MKSVIAAKTTETTVCSCILDMFRKQLYHRTACGQLITLFAHLCAFITFILGWGGLAQWVAHLGK